MFSEVAMDLPLRVGVSFQVHLGVEMNAITGVTILNWFEARRKPESCTWVPNTGPVFGNCSSPSARDQNVYLRR